MNIQKRIENQTNQGYHIIAYKENGFLLGYHNKNKSAFFGTEDYFSHLLTEMPDNYIKWAKNLLEKLKYNLDIFEDQQNYFNIISKN